MEKKDKQIEKDEQYRGVDVNVADKEKVDPKLVEQEVKELNNNPRNNDL